MIPVTGFTGKTVAVFGLARTGLTAARALVAGGAKIAVWDENADARAKAAAEGLPLADLSQADFSRFAALMVSPGVPLTHPEPHWVVKKAQASGVEILGDIELFARTVNAAEPWRRPKIAAITGTNGKSTTTALLGHILNAAGKDALIGGNIGAGVLGLEGMHGGAVYVLELSSYQLDLTSSLKADAAVLLNVSPDHLDRHGGMEGYLAAKRRVFLNQGKGDTAIVGVDDAIGQNLCTELLALNRRTIRPISAGRAMGRGYYALQGLLYDATGERTVEVCDLSRAPGLPGRHNWQNAAAAYAAALALGVSPRRRRRRPDELPGACAPDGGRGLHRAGALRQRQQGHQRRRRPPGHVRHPQVLLDRGRPGEGRRHRAAARPLRPGREGLPDRRGGRRLRPHPGATPPRLRSAARWIAPSSTPGAMRRRAGATRWCCSPPPAPPSTSSPTSRSAATPSAPWCSSCGSRRRAKPPASPSPSTSGGIRRQGGHALACGG